MTDEKRMMKLYAWGDKNNIAVSVLRFSQIHAKTNKEFRSFEVKFIEVKNKHRFSVGRSAKLGEAMDLVWKSYKGKKLNEN